MTEAYRGDCEGGLESGEKSESESAPSVVESLGVAEESELAGEVLAAEAGVQACEGDCRGELHLRPCEWEEFVQLQYRAEDRYDLVEGILVSRVEMVGDDEHSRIMSGLCALISRVWIEGRRVQGHPSPSMKVRSVKEAAAVRAQSEVAVEGGCAGSGASSSSGSEGGIGRKRRGKRRGASDSGEDEDDGSSKGGCREPDVGITFARMSESSDSDSGGGEGERVSFTSERLPIAVVEITSPGTYTEEMRLKWNEYARSGVPDHVIVHRRGVGGGSKGSVIVGSLEPFPGQRVGEMVGSGMENEEARSLRDEPRKTSFDGFYYRRVFRGSEVVDCAVLKKLRLTAREMLSWKALESRVNELDRKAQRTAEGLKRVKETIARVQRTVEEYESGQGVKRSRSERGGSSGSEGSAE